MLQIMVGMFSKLPRSASIAGILRRPWGESRQPPRRSQSQPPPVQIPGQGGRSDLSHRAMRFSSTSVNIGRASFDPPGAPPTPSASHAFYFYSTLPHDFSSRHCVKQKNNAHHIPLNPSFSCYSPRGFGRRCHHTADE